MEKQNNVPKLRFSEFSDAWDMKKLGEAADINPSNKSLPEKFVYIDLESVSNGELLKENEITKSEAPSRAQRVLKENDVLFQMVRPYQMNNLFFHKSGDYVASTGYAQIRTLHNSMYIFQYLHFQKFVDKVIERCTGTSYPAINSTDLSNIPVSFPTLPEQQKIATFLSTIDEKLQALKRKKSLLEIYKKGVMHKLFSQQIRFKHEDGKDFEDWEVKTLGEICSLITKGTTPSQFSKISTGVNFIKIESISIGGKIDISKTLKITDLCHKSLQRSQLQKGDILFSIAGTLGRVAVIEEKDLPANTNQALSIIRLIDSKQLNFLKYHLTTDYISKYIESCTTVGAQPNINLQQVNEILVNLPSLSEQTKIANFLMAIDEKINKVDTQIKQTELWKKGLLQQMFV